MIWLRLPYPTQEHSSPLIPKLSVHPQPTPLSTIHRLDEIAEQNIAEGEGAQQRKQTELLELFNTPINFWGKVVDEKGNPVPDATVELGTADRPWETGSSYKRTTDSNGLFSITGVKGLSISVDVSKGGYYKTSHSRGQFSYAQPSGNKEPLPMPDKPTVFDLRKMGQVEPLVQVDGFVKVPRNGAPVEISFETGDTVAAGQGDLRVEAWTNDQVKDPGGHYDWRCRISVPNGGLTERKEEFAFEAPANGYRPSDEISMPQTEERWSPQVSREYFVKLADGRYARIRFEMVAGGDNFFTINSYLNPKPGSRNLECDPTEPVAVDN